MGGMPEDGAVAEPGAVALGLGAAVAEPGAVASELGAVAVELRGRGPMGGAPGPASVPRESELRQYRFFNHAACEFYPCHDMPADQLNCLFCYCPLYALGEGCGGNFTYIVGADGGRIKDCSACTLPHRVENYDYITKLLGEKRV